MMHTCPPIPRLYLLVLDLMVALHQLYLETVRITEPFFDEYLSLLVDRQWADREGRKMECLLHDAGFGIQATLLVVTDRIWCVLSCNFIPGLRSLGFVQYWGNVLIPELSGQVKICLSGVQKVGSVSLFSGFSCFERACFCWSFLLRLMVFKRLFKGDLSLGREKLIVEYR